MRSIFILALVLIVAEVRAQIFPYSLNHPDHKIILPEILNEISGLTDIDSSHVACVQDEIGTVFIYNFRTQKIVKKHIFDSFGDFEGLTYTGKSLYILRSDGRLTEWEGFNPHTGGGKINHYKLPLLTANNEGLCFDPKTNSLLIAAKSKPIDHDHKWDRFVYMFDLKEKKLVREPVYKLNTMHLEAAKHQFNISNPSSGNHKRKLFNFRPSSLAVHPVSNDIYFISASDQLLVIMNKKGIIKHMEQMEGTNFAKAEGITFLHDGTMIITNEAAGHTPTLLIYRLKSND